MSPTAHGRGSPHTLTGVRLSLATLASLQIKPTVSLHHFAASIRPHTLRVPTKRNSLRQRASVRHAQRSAHFISHA